MLATPPSDSAAASDLKSAERLFPLVYDELRKLAAQRVAGEDRDQSVTPTMLVHEAFLRLSGGEEDPRFQNTRHLYVTAAEAMRWILIDRARARARQKRGGDLKRVDWTDSQFAETGAEEQMLAVDEALATLQRTEPKTAELVKMRFFGGFTLHEIAEANDVSYATIKRRWSFAKAWFKMELGASGNRFPDCE